MANEMNLDLYNHLNSLLTDLHYTLSPVKLMRQDMDLTVSRARVILREFRNAWGKIDRKNLEKHFVEKEPNKVESKS